MSKLPPKDKRLERLLRAGYFLEELPPPFVSDTFAKFRTFLRDKLDKKAPHSAFSRFSIPKHNLARRSLGIPNPINYFQLAIEISDNWVELRKFFRKSTTSEFRPIFDTEGPRAIFGVDFARVEAEISRLQATHNKCLRVDISRFYATIYTHSIGWALYSKRHVKKNLHGTYKNSLADRLDRCIRFCQENQSIGLVIGPDTSRIVSEIIGVAIEEYLSSRLPDFAKRSVRYVDDIVIGLRFEESHEQILSYVAAAFSEFGLEMNTEKTRLIGKNEKFQAEWISQLRNYRISKGTRKKDEILDDYFTNAFYMSSENERENVLTYAVKRSRSFYIGNDVWSHYENYLYRCARYNTSTLSAVFQILIERNFTAGSNDKKPDLDKAKMIVVDIIKQYAPLGYDYEVSWSLFLCKALRIKLDEADIMPVLSMNSPVCALIVIDLLNRGYLPASIVLSYWESFVNPDGLKSDMWLFAYEIAQKGWLPHLAKDYAFNDANFKHLLSKKIYFYDEAKNVDTARREKRERFTQIWKVKFITAHWEEYF